MQITKHVTLNLTLTASSNRAIREQVRDLIQRLETPVDYDGVEIVGTVRMKP